MSKSTTINAWPIFSYYKPMLKSTTINAWPILNIKHIKFSDHNVEKP
jgi:hypothetical protein